MFDSILACATCANNFRDDATNAAGWSIFFMLVVIIPLLAVVVFYMIRLARRSEQSLEQEFRDELPAAPSTR